MMTSAWPPGTFTGDTVSWEIAGVLLSEVRHIVGKSVPAHSHAAAYFGILFEGWYAETAADFDVVYEPYTLVFHSALTPHSDTIGPSGCRMFFVELLQPWMDVIDRLGKSPVHFFELHGGEPIWLMLRLHREFLAREAEHTTTIESLLFELCTYAARTVEDDPREPRWIADVEALLRSEFSAHLNLRDIAAQSNVHPAHLCRAFRRFRGRTIGDFILGLRVQFVCRRLVGSTDTLSDIAQAAGFTDHSHMTRTFKRLTGHSPGSYRKAPFAS